MRTSRSRRNLFAWLATTSVFSAECSRQQFDAPAKQVLVLSEQYLSKYELMRIYTTASATLPRLISRWPIASVWDMQCNCDRQATIAYVLIQPESGYICSQFSCRETQQLRMEV